MMLAFNKKTGAPVLGALDVVQCRPEIVPNSWTRSDGGSLDFEWAGGSEVFWDTSTTVTTGGPTSVADDLLRTAKSAVATLLLLAEGMRSRNEPDAEVVALVAEIEAVVRKAESPTLAVYLDQNGDEVPETEIELCEEDEEEAA